MNSHYLINISNIIKNYIKNAGVILIPKKDCRQSNQLLTTSNNLRL